MTIRLYYDNAYRTSFNATIIERIPINGRFGIILDQTCFYPTSGGQPHDKGTINQAQVVDVFIRESDAAIIHVLDTPLTGDSVSCAIDWQHRFDHMQHHTGQHILTQAFVQLANANTLSFHLSQASVTIDIDKPVALLSQATFDEVEALVNQIIQENRIVSAKIIDPAKTENVRMRKMPDYLTTDGLRVVKIQGFDKTACGGTHVANTGEIGLFKILKVERRGENTRVEFRCGNRALQDYSERFAITSQLSNHLTCHHTELPGIIEKMQEELKNAHNRIRGLSNRFRDMEAAELLSRACRVGEVDVVTAVISDRDRGESQQLAARLADNTNTVVLIGLPGDKSHFIFACHESLGLDLNPLIRQAFEIIGGGRGGGRPNMVQGGGVPATFEQIKNVLDSVSGSLDTSSSIP